MKDESPVSQLLMQWGHGAPEVEERLLAAVQTELRRIASTYMRRERAGHTLQPTAVVNEAYLRLVEHSDIAWEVAEITQLSYATVRRDVASARFFLGLRMRGV